MNERIRELATEAEFYEKDLHIQADNFQKFAELIVEECIKKIDKDVVVFTKNDIDTKNLCIGIIKQHFGV
mgnify:CR=1 FL=1